MERANVFVDGGDGAGFAGFGEGTEDEAGAGGETELLNKDLDTGGARGVEAELIGNSDMLPQVIWTRESLAEQGYKCGPTRLFHDDHMSTAMLASKGSSTGKRTRHIAIKCYYVRDKIGSSEVVVERLPTEYVIVYAMTETL